MPSFEEAPIRVRPKGLSPRPAARSPKRLISTFRSLHLTPARGSIEPGRRERLGDYRIRRRDESDRFQEQELWAQFRRPDQQCI